MTHPADIARELAELGRSDRRNLTRLAAAQTKLAANAARRCELLTEAAGLACDAGHITAVAAEEAIAPKDD